MDKDRFEAEYTEAARAALQHFPVKVKSLDLVAQSENVTFRVSTSGSDKDYVLRLHRPGYNSIEELESEREWVGALRESGVAVPESLETLTGGHFALVDVPGSTVQCYVGMTTWHEGVPLRDYLESCADESQRVRIFHRFGEIAAAFHNQSTRWQAPPGFVRRRLDLDALLGEAPFWGRFWEHPALTASEQASLLQAREHGRIALNAYGENSDNFSLIHADFTPDNIIYADGKLAVIDFDDAAYGWHMYDLTSALVECQFDENYETVEAALLDGYRKNRSLTSRDVEILPEFMLIRGMAVIGWYGQRPEHAGSANFDRYRSWVLDCCAQRGL